MGATGSVSPRGNTIAFCELDVVVNDRDRGLKVIRNCLREYHAPDDTVIEEYIPKFKELPLERDLAADDDDRGEWFDRGGK